MSRASSYRNAAADLRRSSTHLTDLALLHRRLTADTIGAAGPVASIHDRSVDTATGQLAVAADQLSQLADECDRRADVCDDFARRFATWRGLPVLERTTTPPPLPPARWVVG